MCYKDRTFSRSLVSWLMLGQYVLLALAANHFHTCAGDHPKLDSRRDTHEKTCFSHNDHSCVIDKMSALCLVLPDQAVKKGTCWVCSYLIRNHVTIDWAPALALSCDVTFLNLQGEISLANRDIPSCLRGRAPPTLLL